MKKKILATILIGIFFTFIIYKLFYHEKVIITSLGDSLSLGYTAYNIRGYSYNDYLKDYLEEQNINYQYNSNFSHTNETTETLLLKLENNYTLKDNISITNAIHLSSILTIAIGMDELNKEKEITSKEIDNYLTNMNKIIKVITAHNKKKIFLISLYQTNNLSKEKVKIINAELKKIADTNNIIFIDISTITNNKNFFFDNNNYELNYKGHKYISQEIIKKL